MDVVDIFIVDYVPACLPAQYIIHKVAVAIWLAIIFPVWQKVLGDLFLFLLALSWRWKRN